MEDPLDPRVMDGEIWAELCATLAEAHDLFRDDSFPFPPEDRAEYLRYLLQFLASGISVCVAHGDPDHPELTRMMDLDRRWGLDSPDHLYLFASVRGDAEYIVSGDPGTANLVDFQVNEGHYALGDVASTRTQGSLILDELDLESDGSVIVYLGGEARERNWLPLRDGGRFFQLRQVFADWENERPAELRIERVGGAVMRPRVRTDQIAERVDLLRSWMSAGGSLWRDMSKAMLAMPRNTLAIPDPQRSSEFSGLKGQAYGMGNFYCAPDEVVLLEFEPPPCRHWSVSLATWWWEAIDPATRQSSLNHAQAVLDPDGMFRAVIAHSDPGHPNWLDCAGHDRGTLIARFVMAEASPIPRYEVIARSALEGRLPLSSQKLSASERESILGRRRRAMWRRFRR
jgi:hypothetical protein